MIRDQIKGERSAAMVSANGKMPDNKVE